MPFRQPAKPDYRQIENNKIIIDINNLYTDEHNLTNTTLFYPQNSVLRDIPHNNPYEFKAENVVISCQTSGLVVINGYDVYRHRVSDAGLLIMKLQKQENKIAQAACNPNVAQKLPLYTFPKTWQPEPIIQTEPIELTQKLFNVIQAHQIAAPKETVSKIVIAGESVHQGKKKPFSETYHIKPTGTPNLFKQDLIADNYRSTSLQFLGQWQTLIDITHFNSTLKHSTTLLKYQQSTNWTHAPNGTKFTFSSEQKEVSSLFGQAAINKEYECQIMRTFPAKTLHPNIKGQARELQCQLQGDTYKRINTGYYLVDYHYFINLKVSPNEFHYQSSQISLFE